jgi:hypothetical protein
VGYCAEGCRRWRPSEGAVVGPLLRWSRLIRGASADAAVWRDAAGVRRDAARSCRSRCRRCRRRCRGGVSQWSSAPPSSLVAVEAVDLSSSQCPAKSICHSVYDSVRILAIVTLLVVGPAASRSINVELRSPLESRSRRWPVATGGALSFFASLRASRLCGWVEGGCGGQALTN